MNLSLITLPFTNRTYIVSDGTYLYWTNDAHSIARANLDGTGVNQSFITTNGVVQGVAVVVPEPATGMRVMAGVGFLASVPPEKDVVVARMIIDRL